MNLNPVGVRWGPLARIRSQLIIRVHEISDSAFAELDGFAWTQNWQVSRGLTGHGYRDPRFDALVKCSRCDGAGEEGAHIPCADCSGSGRIDLAGRSGSR